MGWAKRTERQRCTVCRGWYRPHKSTGNRQKTCSAKCRKERKRAFAGKRRRQDVERSRREERRRQRKRRARVNAETAGLKGSEEIEVSRVGVRVEIAEAERFIAETWDEILAMSRAWLKRRLRIPSGARAETVGQGGTRKGRCHAPGKKDRTASGAG